MPTISLKLPESLDSRLSEEAKRRRTSKSAVVRECVETLLNAAPNGQSTSCLGIASDLAGCLDGPSDIATNPKYLDDFGL
jgi:predicted transcriptional regulator